MEEALFIVLIQANGQEKKNGKMRERIVVFICIFSVGLISNCSATLPIHISYRCCSINCTKIVLDMNWLKHGDNISSSSWN